MDVALGGNLTSMVADQYHNAQKTGLFLSEPTARYYFRQFIHTGPSLSKSGSVLTLGG